MDPVYFLWESHAAPYFFAGETGAAEGIRTPVSGLAVRRFFQIKLLPQKPAFSKGYSVSDNF